MRLSVKLLLYILSVTILIFISVVHIINVRFEKYALQTAQSKADLMAARFASDIESELNEDMGVLRSLSMTFKNSLAIPPMQRDSLNIQILRDVLLRHPRYIALFLQWELEVVYDTSSASGRRRESLYRDEQGKINTSVDLIYHSDDTTTIYKYTKQEKKEVVVDPYYYSYTQNKSLPQSVQIRSNDILETTIIVPILSNGNFLGLVGADIPLEQFRSIVDTIQPFKDSYGFLLANNGKWLFDPDSSRINQSIHDVLPHLNETYAIADHIAKGEPLSFIASADEAGMDTYYSFYPVKIGNNKKSWSFGISYPLDVILSQAHQHLKWTLSVLFLGIVALIIVIYLISNNITYPLKKVNGLLQQVARGNIRDRKPLRIPSADEIGELTISTNMLLEKLKRTARFAYEIGLGNYQLDYELLSDEDQLGVSLIDMRNNLRTVTLELQKLSMVASKTDNAIAIMDADGVIEWTNKAMMEMVEMKHASILGKSIIDISLNDNIEDIINECKKIKRSVIYENSDPIEHPQIQFIQTTLTPVLDEDNCIINIISVDSDITHIRQAERKISSQKQKIEKQRDELSDLLATRDKFFSIIAHDMKNPWASLLSITQSLSDNMDDFDAEETRFYLRKVYKSADMIHDMLQNLLFWASSQTGRIDFTVKEVDFNKLLDVIFIMYEMNAEKKNISLMRDIPDLAMLYADENMLSTVLQNLINNAIKFTPTDGKVTVTFSEFDSFVQISVKDTGIGISPEDQKKLFRVDVKTKSIGPEDKEKGTGLGLILCKEFVEYHKGAIRVESKEGNGAEFIFTLSKHIT